nr:MAG TPA: hypothetical protein [Caudoviricetes sp.]
MRWQKILLLFQLVKVVVAQLVLQMVLVLVVLVLNGQLLVRSSRKKWEIGTTM